MNVNTQTRTRSFARNFKFSALTSLVNVFTGLFSRNVFLAKMGEEYLGTGGLFGNIFVLFSLFEFGVFSSCVFLLYKPITNRNEAKILSLVSFAKSYFKKVFFVILALSLLLFPFVQSIVDVHIPNINVIFLIHAASCALPFLTMHKKLILFSDRREYIMSLYSTVFGVLCCALQTAVAVFTKNYVFYLLTRLVLCTAEDIAICFYADRKYPFLKRRVALERDAGKAVIKYARSLFPHRACAAALRSVDNILVCALFGVAQNAVYSNYTMLQGVFSCISACVFDAIGANIGNLCAKSDKQKAKGVFDAVFFINFTVSTISCVCLFCAGEDILRLFLPHARIPTSQTRAFICFLFFSSQIRSCVLVFRENYGLFGREKIKPYLDTALTLFFCIVLCRKIGIGGIFLAYGGVGLLFSAPVEAHTLFKYGLSCRANTYLRTLFVYCIFCVYSCALCHVLCSRLLCEDYAGLFFKIIICCFTTLANILLFFCKSAGYRQLGGRLKHFFCQDQR